MSTMFDKMFGHTQRLAKSINLLRTLFQGVEEENIKGGEIYIFRLLNSFFWHFLDEGVDLYAWKRLNSFFGTF